MCRAWTLCLLWEYTGSGTLWSNKFEKWCKMWHLFGKPPKHTKVLEFPPVKNSVFNDLSPHISPQNSWSWVFKNPSDYHLLMEYQGTNFQKHSLSYEQKLRDKGIQWIWELCSFTAPLRGGDESFNPQAMGHNQERRRKNMIYFIFISYFTEIGALTWIWSQTTAFFQPDEKSSWKWSLCSIWHQIGKY